MKDKTAAIVVSFHPETSHLDRLFDALITQVDKIIVADNGSSPETVAWLFAQSIEDRIHLLTFGDNFGIGFAQNRGIELAREQGYERFLLFDQDSLPTPGLVLALDRALDQLALTGVRVGAVGPMRDDENDPSPTYFQKFDRFPPRHLYCSDASPFVQADVLISSGMLVPLQAIQGIGLMDERLFIDHVDTEWCLRGLARDFRFFGVCDARIQHKLGLPGPRLWLGRWRNLTIHSPIRNYYFVRNSATLIRRNYIPGLWKCYMAWTLLKYFPRNFLVPQRALRLLMMSRGLFHSLVGRLGRLY